MRKILPLYPIYCNDCGKPLTEDENINKWERVEIDPSLWLEHWYCEECKDKKE